MCSTCWYLWHPAGAVGIRSFSWCAGRASDRGGYLTFDTTVQIPGLMSVGLVMAGLLAAYIPLTQMSHFIGKYFSTIP
jgi:hypothetical protein